MIARFVRSTLQLVGFVTILMIVFFGVGFPFVGLWLQPQDQPERSDFIIVLAGDQSRCLKAADIYKQGFAPVIMLSNEYVPPQSRVEKIMADLGYPEPNPNVLGRRILVHLGIPKKAINLFGKGSASTTDEAEAFHSVVASRTFKAILVTSPFQARRAKMIFDSKLPNGKFFVVSPPDRAIDARWWRDKQSALDTGLELMKIAYFWLGGAFHAPSQ
jgi:uncharacterized SAM-binding protein YcdF (DUF218 family)